MILRLISSAVLAASLACHAVAQSNAPAFEIADVHQIPIRKFTFDVGGILRGDRYTLRNHTMAELVSIAYGVDVANVTGGPPWLERDRYDIIAKAPHDTTPKAIDLMLQTLLAERFHLVLHNDSKPLPAYVLTVGKGGKPRMKASDGVGDRNCDDKTPPRDPAATTVPPIVMSCRHMTMADFPETLRDWAGFYFAYPIVDQTGLTGAYDFDLTWTAFGRRAQAGPDLITVYDAVDKQLGLKLDLLTAPRPVIAVDSVDEKPTPNRPDLEKVFPAPPPAEFEVATIKPSKPGTTETNVNVGGNKLEGTGMTIKLLIDFAWDLNPNDKEVIVDAPRWLDDARFDILAKAAAEPPTPGHKVPEMDTEDLRAMLRQLLTERFNLKAHRDLRPITGYTLLAVSPKLKRSDPTARTGCKDGPGPDGKDPRIANPMRARLLFCQNMNMAQFGVELQILTPGYIFNPVLDSTGLTGGWDFQLSFSTAAQLQNGPGDNGVTSTGDGPISLFDAVNKELGLKLEKGKRPIEALVIDHIDEKPTEN